MPAIGALNGSVSSRNSTLDPGAPLQLKANGHEVVRRPRTRVGELELPLVAPPDLLDLLVEELRLGAVHQERRIEDHPVANDLVRARGDRRVAQLVIDLVDERLGLLRERLL